MALQRKTKFNELLFQGEVWIPAAELLKKYRCPRLLTLTEKDYSKLGAIDSPGGVVTKALCRALLTDRGMLFAQTREKGYPRLYSKRWIETTRRLDLALNRMGETGLTGAPDDEATKRILLDMAEHAWQKNADTGENTMHLIHECLCSIIDQCGSMEAFSQVTIDNIDGLYYFTKTTGSESPHAVQMEMETIRGRCMCTCVTEPRSCTVILPTKAPFCLQKLQEALTPNELRTFLTDVLLRCVERAGKIVSNREQCKPAYRQMVAESQVACIEQQVQDYREEDLEAWRQAQIVLGKICSPDINRYNIQPLSQYERGPTKCLEDDLAVCLQNTFRHRH